MRKDLSRSESRYDIYFHCKFALAEKNTPGSKLPLLLTVGKKTAQMVLACLQALVFVLVVLY